MTAEQVRLWGARLCIGVVLVANVQCALAFWLMPQAYAPAYELSGVTGEAALRGLGVLFLMWNVPYVVALWHPRRQRLSLWEAIAMQAIGVAGESLIGWSGPSGHPLLHTSLMRFILFDGAGLLLLLGALALTRSTHGSSNAKIRL